MMSELHNWQKKIKAALEKTGLQLPKLNDVIF
jgi:hypothetical protein